MPRVFGETAVPTTTVITQSRTIALNETVAFVDTDGFELKLLGEVAPNLTNLGTISVTLTTFSTVYGLYSGYGGPFGEAVFTNEASGVFRVNAVIGGAIGSYSVYTAPDIINRGLFEIIGAGGGAIGVFNGDPGFILTNSGQFLVSGIQASGLTLDGGGRVINSGQILVTGGAGGSAGISLGGITQVINSGTIRATATNGGAAYAFELRGGGLFLVNSGLVEGQYAVHLSTSVYANPSGVDVIVNSGQIHGLVDLSTGDDLVRNRGEMVGRIDLGLGDDVYDGSAGTNGAVVWGGIGNDLLLGGTGADVFFGDAGADVIVAGAGDDFVDGGAGGDDLDGGDGFDTLSFASATAAASVDLAAGTASASGRDRVKGFERVIGSAGGDSLTGSNAADTLEGRAGADVIAGGGGNDRLVGGEGADTLTGGAGDDVFVFAAGDGADTVTDFAIGDRLRIFDYSAYQQLVQQGADTLVVLAGGDSILLKNVQAVSLTAADFVFDASPLVIETLPASPPATGAATLATADVILGVDDQLYMTSGFVLGRVEGSGVGPSFYNAGLVHIEDVADRTVVGVFKHYADRTTQTFFNQSTGVIEVVSRGTRQATGYDSGYTNVTNGRNDGRIEISSEGGYAIGIVSDESEGFRFVNTGLIKVTSSQSAGIGVQVSYSGAFWNSGVIDATGGQGAVGAGIYGTTTFVNTGTVRATQTSQANYTVVALYSNSSGPLFNAGTLQGVYAAIAVGSGAFYNSGVLNGLVLFGDAWNLLFNSGDIRGQITLGDGNDRYEGRTGTQTGGVFGEGGSDTLLAGAGDDLLDGGAGDDLLSGGAGQDTLTGGAGNDTFHCETGFGADVITDLDGGDVIEMVGYSAYQSVTQAGADALVAFSGGDSLLLRNTQAASVTPGLFHFNASALSPAATPPSAPATPVAPVAPSVPAGSVLTPPMFGTANADVLTGGTGLDTIFGQSGDDQISGAAGADRLFGGLGADRFLSSTGDGNDLILDFDAAQGDVLRLDSASYRVRQDGADTLVNLGDGRVITLRGGIDVRHAVELAVLAGMTEALGTAGADTLEGDAGRSLLRGGSGGDILRGNDGDDRLEGGFGDDTLIGGAGADDLEGGMGADTFVIIRGGGADTIRDFDPTQGDVLRLEGFTGYFVTQLDNGDIRLNGYGGAYNTSVVLQNMTLAQARAAIQILPATPTGPAIVGTDSGELVDGGGPADRLEGGAGDDILRGFGDGDILVGGAGVDILDGGPGTDGLSGGAGADIFVYRVDDGDDLIRDFNPAEGDRIRVDGEATFTYVINNNSNGDVIVQFLNNGTTAGTIVIPNSTIATVQAAIVRAPFYTQLGDYTRTVTGTSGANTLTGTTANEVMDGQGGNDKLDGKDGDDLLGGGEGNDTLIGGNGSDVLVGGLGNDIMTGGAGRDYFLVEYTGGADVITDFNPLEDVLDVRRDVILTATQQGADTLLTFYGGETVRLSNVALSSLTMDNFLGSILTPPIKPVLAVSPPPPPPPRPRLHRLHRLLHHRRALRLHRRRVLRRPRRRHR